MNTLDSNELIQEAIDKHKMTLLYFGSKGCGVCVDMKPKMEKLLKEYPMIKGIYIDVEKSHNIAIQYDFFTIPGIILFIEGKETIREARNISIRDLHQKIDRYYNLLI